MSQIQTNIGNIWVNLYNFGADFVRIHESMRTKGWSLLPMVAYCRIQWWGLLHAKCGSWGQTWHGTKLLEKLRSIAMGKVWWSGHISKWWMWYRILIKSWPIMKSDLEVIGRKNILQSQRARPKITQKSFEIRAHYKIYGCFWVPNCMILRWFWFLLPWIELLVGG